MLPARVSLTHRGIATSATSVLALACPATGRLTLWGDFGLYPTEALRLWVVDAEDAVIIATAESEQARDFDAFMVAAQPVLDSLAIAGPPLPDDVAVTVSR